MAFTTPGVGYKSKLLIAREVTPGTTPAAADAGMELMSATITPKLSVITDPSLNNSSVSPRFIGQGGQSFEATFRFRIGYEGLLSLLRMFYPVYSQTTVDTNLRSHVFKEASASVPGWSYSLDFLWGDVPSGQSTRMTYCYGTSLRITGQAGTGESAMLIGEATVVGRTCTPATTPIMTGGSFPTALGVIYHQLLRTTGNFKDGSATTFDSIQLRSMEFSVNHPYDTNRFLFGQVNAETPVRSGFVDASWMFDEEWADVNLLNIAKAGNPGQLKVLFEHPTVVGATTGKRQFEIIASSPTPGEYSTEVPGFGVITQRVGYKLAYNTTDLSHAIIRVQSLEAAMTY
jgi:hypothetical protein